MPVSVKLFNASAVVLQVNVDTRLSHDRFAPVDCQYGQPLGSVFRGILSRFCGIFTFSRNLA